MPKCPTCGKPVAWKDNLYRPFCCERCKLIDFDKWISEEFRVPGQPVNPAEIAEHSGPPDHSGDYGLFNVGVSNRFMSDVYPYRNMANHVYRFC